MNKSKAKILVLDDHRLFVDSIKLVLQRMSEVTEVTTAYNASSVLSDLTALRRYDLALIDIIMPGLDGIGFLQALQSRNIRVPVALLSGSEQTQHIERALSLGAVGYIPKSSSTFDLQVAVRELLAGKRYIPKDLYGKLNIGVSTASPLQEIDCSATSLSQRQKEMLKLIRDGCSNKEIGTILGISESTVKTHVSMLFKQLGVKNRTSCLRRAQELDL